MGDKKLKRGEQFMAVFETNTTEIGQWGVPCWEIRTLSRMMLPLELMPDTRHDLPEWDWEMDSSGDAESDADSDIETAEQHYSEPHLY